MGDRENVGVDKIIIIFLLKDYLFFYGCQNC